MTAAVAATIAADDPTSEASAPTSTAPCPAGPRDANSRASHCAGDAGRPPDSRGWRVRWTRRPPACSSPQAVAGTGSGRAVTATVAARQALRGTAGIRRGVPRPAASSPRPARRRAFPIGVNQAPGSRSAARRRPGHRKRPGTRDAPGTVDWTSRCGLGRATRRSRRTRGPGIHGASARRAGHTGRARSARRTSPRASPRRAARSGSRRPGARRTSAAASTETGGTDCRRRS